MSRPVRNWPLELVTQGQRVDRLQALSAQLSALTVSLYGDGLPNFQSLADPLQDSILWLVSDMAAEIAELAGRVRYVKDAA